jgi:hypothetical protein
VTPPDAGTQATASFFAAPVVRRESGGTTAFTTQQRERVVLLATRIAGTIAGQLDGALRIL